MKRTRMLLKLWNHAAKSDNKRTLTSSLQHSLRIVPENQKDPKSFQWNEDKSPNNIFISDGEIKTFADVSPAETQAFFDKLKPESESQKERDSDRQTFANYKAKLTKAIAAETKKGNTEAAEILQGLADIPLHQERKEETFSHLVQRLNETQMSRKNQRIGMVEKYIDAVKKLSSSPILDKRKAQLQEGLFKFPRPSDEDIKEHGLHHVTEIKPLDYYENVKAFYAKFFPDYPVNNGIIHLDEHINEELEDAIHLHYYVSTKNQSTGKVDLLDEQVRVVNEYIKSKITDEKQLEHELIPTEFDDRKSNQRFKHESSRLMSYYQDMFFEFTNENLLKNYDIEAVKSPESVRKGELAKQRNFEAHLPKAQRSHNYATAKAEDAEKREATAEKNLEELDAKRAEKLASLAALDTEIARRDKAIAQRDNVISEQKSEVKILNDQKVSLQEAVQNLSFQSSSLEEEITIKKTILSSLNESIRDLKFKVSQQFELIAKDLNYRVKALFHGNIPQANALFRGIMSNYVDIQNDVTRDACKATAKAFEDKQVVDAMKFDDKSKDRDDSDLTL